MDEFIDTRDSQREYEYVTQSFLANEEISRRNKELVMDFLRDCGLGKTSPGRKKKRIGLARQSALLVRLKIPIRYFASDLENVTQREMEDFVSALENDVIVSAVDGNRLSESYKANVKAAVRKFYKWLLGNGREFPPLVEWIDTYEPRREVPALSKNEVERLLDASSGYRNRAFIQLLFDGGMRLGEILNIRLKHVWLQGFDSYDETRKCFFVRIAFSKTRARTISLPMADTTKWLSYWLGAHPWKPSVGVDGTLEATDLDAPLFPMTAQAARHLLKKVGQSALDKRVYPHLLRHTSATYWAGRLPYFRFCKRFGWRMNSPMPERYIDKQGLHEEETARIYYGSRRRVPDSVGPTRGSLAPLG